jgi:hypothetical protein
MPNPDLHPIHSPNAEDSIDVDVLTLIEAPEVAAYSLLTKFYDLFDAGPELIPFTKKSEKGPAVDAEALKRL